MKTFFAPCLILLAAAASAATPLENASLIAESLGAAVETPAGGAIPTPAAAALESASLSGASGSVSGSATATGSGSMSCSGGRWGGGIISGWVNLRADVAITTEDGASARVPVTGSIFLSGSCQHGSGFVNGSTTLNGTGTLYKAGRAAGTVSLSGNANINQYVTAPFASISQSVFLNGRYDESAAAAR